MNTSTTSTPGIGAISVVGIPVNDQDRALEFYSGRLGFTVQTDTPLPGSDARWIMLTPGTGASIALVQASLDAAAGVDTGIRFHTDDADATHAALLPRGVRVGEVLRWPGVPAMFEAFDCDGNRFEIVE
jgi:catechol 2,3-dioxygenase-like lactoylglutathione lyase family enzyme